MLHAPCTRAANKCAPRCRVTQARSVDTEVSGSSYATGFIVDAERGLILTNRHVVTPGAQACSMMGACHAFLCFLLPLGRPAFSSPAGPVTAEAIFHNREEVAVKVSSSSDVKLR